MSVSPPSEEVIPRQIGEYRVDCILEKGGTSIVYLGNHPKSKIPLAIKTLSGKHLKDPAAAERFMQEAAIIEKMNHPNIIHVYGHGKWEGGYYIAMEFVQGISLRQVILQQATSLRRSIEIGLQITHAITHLHAQGIVHRDLKPENVMLTAQGGVKLIDFGTAKFYTSAEAQQQILGTPSYMSPEQRDNPRNASFPADIFAIGVIIYELILGRLCYGQIQISMIPKGLQPILSKMLQPKPEDRYEDIVDVVQALSHYMNSNSLTNDMRGSDYLGELGEDLKATGATLLPRNLPVWPSMRIGFTSNCNMALSAVYYDFFEKGIGEYSVIIGESLATGVSGLVEISMLKGMARALAHTKIPATEFIAKLNNLLVDLGGDQTFSLAMLTLMPREQRYSFISCGYNALWHIPAGARTPRRVTSNNVALGIQPDIHFMEVDSNWAIGDNLVFYTFQAGSAGGVEEVERDERNFLAALKQNLHLTPQKQVDAIFRQVTSKDKAGLLQKLVTIVSIERIE